jgi:heme exporter protein A
LTALLTFSDVALKRGGRLLFEGMSFDQNAGEALHVAGPNGSGKSSLLRLAAGLLRQAGGEVSRSALALADEHLALDRELPLRRALGFWGGAVEEAMDAVGLSQLAAVPVRLLSSGQAKRASLARVAASGAPLWLLDEPLNALDADGTERLTALIDAHRARGGAVLAASHLPLAGDWQRREIRP